jgi:broad specificity phosphatase PhoE
MGQIFLVRHGQASFGQANYDQLSDLGAQQARLLGRWFAQQNQQFQRIVCGDMRRHEQTATACLSEMAPNKLQQESDAGFNEYDHHEVLLRHRPEFADPAAVQRFLRETPNAQRAFQQEFQLAMARWMDGWHDAEYAEPWPQFQQRCVAALNRLIESAKTSQDILVFTSGGTIATLCQHVLGLPDRKMAELNWTLVNAAVTKLFYQPDRLALSYLNNFSHLEHLGDAGTVTYR